MCAFWALNLMDTVFSDNSIFDNRHERRVDDFDMMILLVCTEKPARPGQLAVRFHGSALIPDSGSADLFRFTLTNAAPAARLQPDGPGNEKGACTDLRRLFNRLRQRKLDGEDLFLFSFERNPLLVEF
jgi:hypothetical protein